MRYPQIPMNAHKDLRHGFFDETFGIRMQASDEGVDIFLHGIVGDPFDGTDSMSISQQLTAHRGKPVTLRVNSPGGLAYDGVAIFNALQEHDGATTGIIQGLAGSAASLAVMACDTVICHQGGQFHPHYGLILALGHQAELRDALLQLESLDRELEKLYSARSGRTIAQVQDDLLGPNGDGTVFSAEEARDAGYVDEIIATTRRSPPPAAANFSAQRLHMLRRRVDLIPQTEYK